ncbi:MAG: (E)-4-hydroxy-3-methylbut-2-enyl-diphosphate synthase [Paramuribaculum sp.]|nr:(E)-4-hydroxy-3-methylbut-2-enyl-diphosphate synthase [Paramuribaculum sp.]
MNIKSTEFDCCRRHTTPVRVGNLVIGGDQRVVLQSMASTSTMDTAASVAQCTRIAQAGAQMVRLTAQGVREANNLAEIRAGLRECGIEVPLVADIHFNPRAAFAAAEVVEKVRINPGNFVDPGRTFRKLEYTDQEYAAELQKIDDALTPFLDLCREHGTALRIGVNHGSLSDRIMSRYGDTPEGMAESAMEFLRVCVKRGFSDVVISVKASNVCVMVETVRRLVRAMDAENMHFPLHLGVTEAGDGEDGRIKSCVGIGTLMAEGIGDTIRVSLSEEPECELPVAAMLRDYIEQLQNAPHIEGCRADAFDAIIPQRRKSAVVGAVGGANLPVVVGSGSVDSYDADRRPDLIAGDFEYKLVDAAKPVEQWGDITPGTLLVLTSTHPNRPGSMQSSLHRMIQLGIDNPVILKVDYGNLSAEEIVVQASVDFGALLMNGFRDGVWIESSTLGAKEIVSLSYGILQAARLRITRTEYISCPGCGRTLFNLQSTLAAVKEATASLRGLKIGVMGCIVNGPGEMADADYGYVGAGVGRISLYRGKECVEKNIPESEAVEHLVNLIKADGKWK